MKRTIIMLMTLIFSVSLAGCVGSSNKKVKEPSNVVTNVETENTDSNNEKAEDSKTNTKDDEKQKESNKTDVTIEETVLVDEAGVKVVAKKLETEELFGPELKVFIENNSGKNLTFSCKDTSINGYMVDGIMSSDVVNGKKVNDTILFSSSDLKACGIDEIADIDLKIKAYDEDYQEYIYTDVINIKTSKAEGYEYKYDDSGSIAYEDSGIKIVVKSLTEKASIFGPSIVIYVENNSDKDITLQVRDVSINGFMVDPTCSCDVVKGKHAVDTITFMESDLEENGINDTDEIKNVELSFHIFEMHGWDTIKDTDTITIGF